MIQVTNFPEYKTALDEALASYGVDTNDPEAIKAFSLGHMVGWINAKTHTLIILEKITRDGGDKDGDK